MIRRAETTAATRISLEAAAATVTDGTLGLGRAGGAESRVLGWVDLTSPNLVDLLEDLTAICPDALVGLHWNFVSGFANDVCVVRGLRTLADYGIPLRVEGAVDEAAVLAIVPQVSILAEPGQ